MQFSQEDELAYLELINKVAKISIEAAVYMQHEMRELESFEPDGSLWCVITWQDTPQGHTYWAKITSQIEKEEE
jgi:hypothetical protein